MTVAEREAFLAGPHVGVLSVADPGHAPLIVPVWYTYEPGGLVSVVTGRSSRKAARVEAEQRFSLCAQTETAPYQYVSVEGPVARTEPTVTPEERRAVAYRYLGQELGDLYLASTEADAGESLVLRMRPERWLTVDYNKQFA
jgi:nitroimidazol reductase NimA-like FMN-containing flavoprotein (pyridoxamine 5'-phosphate oxidase superfamily)